MIETVRMFVNGEAMSGGRLNPNLADAAFLGARRTAARYRFYSVRDEFPGLHPAREGGISVPGELYAVGYATLRDRLLPEEPPELELSVIELDDQTGSLCMRMRAEALNGPGVTDISVWDGWREYLRVLLEKGTR